jgi:3-deoxy-D-manno-octulosonate 8-phosphate phosphatase (KDO 8-P phosphatase)
MTTPLSDAAGPDAALAARCAGIAGLVVDVDGVLTDGVIAVDDHGVETKRFHVRDGWALNAWRRLGKRTAVISGRDSKATARRAAELGIGPVIQGAAAKSGPFRQLLAELGVGAEQVAYMGDDLPDLPVLAAAGLAACPADAVEEVHAACHYVTQAVGGHGAVREVIELILKHQGLWEPLLEPLRTPATADIAEPTSESFS